MTEQMVKQILERDKNIFRDRKTLREIAPPDLEQRLEELRVFDEAVRKALAGVENPRHRGILFDHYIRGKSWLQVSLQYYYGERTIYNVDKLAIQELKKEMEKDPILTGYSRARTLNGEENHAANSVVLPVSD